MIDAFPDGLSDDGFFGDSFASGFNREALVQRHQDRERDDARAPFGQVEVRRNMRGHLVERDLRPRIGHTAVVDGTQQRPQRHLQQQQKYQQQIKKN